jgi:hypothetical protein
MPSLAAHFEHRRLHNLARGGQRARFLRHAFGRRGLCGRRVFQDELVNPPSTLERAYFCPQRLARDFLFPSSTRFWPRADSVSSRVRISAIRTVTVSSSQSCNSARSRRLVFPKASICPPSVSSRVRPLSTSRAFLPTSVVLQSLCRFLNN